MTIGPHVSVCLLNFITLFVSYMFLETFRDIFTLLKFKLRTINPFIHESYFTFSNRSVFRTVT